MMTVITLVCVWTLASIAYAITQLGNKNQTRKDYWWEWVLFIPAIGLAYIIGHISRLLDRITNRK